MTRHDPSPLTRPAGRRRLFSATCAVLLVVALHATARAQWTQPDANQNINNTNSGKVGVGTSAPTDKLSVEGNLYAGGTQMWGTGGVRVANRNLSGGWRFAACDGGGDVNCPPGGVVIHQDGVATRLAFTAGGNVGVGTQSPNQRLGVQGMIGLYPQAWAAPNVRGMFMYHGGSAAAIYAYNYPAGTGDPISITGSRLDFSTYVGGNGLQRMSIANDGKVGIGTSNPSEALDVAGAVNASAGLCIAGICKTSWSQVSGASQWGTAGASLYFNTGNVGLGTAGPAFRLDAAGTIRGVGENSVGINNQYAFNGGGQQHNWSQGFPKFGALGRGGAPVYGDGAGQGTNPGAIFIGGGGVDQTGGAAGVFAKGGDTGAQEWNLAWGGVGLFAEGGQNGPGGNTWAVSSRYAAAAFFNGYVQIGSNDGRQSGLAIGFDGYNGRGALAPSGGSLLVGGSVGVGTPAPSYKLDVQGGQVNASAGLCIAGDCRASWAQVTSAGNTQWSNGEGAIYFNAGSVGVGTNSPGAKLHVESGSLLLGDRGGNWGSMLRLSPPAGAVTWDVYNERASGLLRFHDATHSRDALTMDGAGNLSMPSGDLNVTGAITGGSIHATYQDVAEWVPSTQKLQAGTVVVLDAEKTNSVVASVGAYDTKVAGVVSAEPGVILGVGGEGKLKVATTGRVRVRVDATRAPIKVGDLLVTSDAEGLAMKSVPVDLGGTQIHRPGTIIGKALEPLEKGAGEILVLLSLQ